jgi:hypothetical protein
MLTGSSSAVSSSPQDAGDWDVAAAARVRASIGHPHLMRLRVQNGKRPQLVPELCSAPTLARELARRPLPAADAVQTVVAVASAVQALAAHGLAPRELSPESIYMDRRRGTILSDAGVPATLVPRLDVVSQAARPYLSPEELGGFPPTAESLVYTLGAVLRESVRGDAPAPLVRVIERATAVDPVRRYEHPGAFASAAVATVRGPKAAAPGPSRTEQERRPAPAADGGAITVRRRTERARFEATVRTALRAAAAKSARVARDGARRGAVAGAVAASAIASVTRDVASGMEAFATTRAAKRDTRLSLSRRAAAIGTVVLAVGGGLAITTLPGGGDDHRALASDVLTLDLPSGWEPSRVPGTRGMALAGAVATSSSDEHARLVVGLARDSAQVRHLVGAAAAEGAIPRNVQLGGLEAQRWTNARVSRDTPAALFLGYTSSGPLVAICHQPAGGTSAHGAPCSAALETLRLTGPRPVSLASVEQIRRELRSALSVLGEDRIEGRRALATAPLADEQANAAESLALSFSFASQTIAAIPTPRGTTDLSAVVGALDATAGAYDGLADAILGGDPIDFDVAKQQILDEEAGLQRNIAAAAIR